jgi:hypothetical protein
MKHNIEAEIKSIIDQIDTLKDKFIFKNSENEEEAWDGLEAAVVGLDEFQEIYERDAEYDKVKKMMKN